MKLQQAEFAERQMETVTFGHWKQGSSGETYPIVWNVLKEYGDCILLHAAYGLECMAYDEEGHGVYWEDSNIRRWLNSEFLSAFCDSEQSSIVEVELENKRDLRQDIPTIYRLKEKVFLLSQDEINALEINKRQWTRKPSPWAKRRGAYSDRNGNGVWWLRSYGRLENLSMGAVRPDGAIYPGADVRAENVMVCPALFVRR